MKIIRKHDAIVSLIPGAELIMENDTVIQWINPTESSLTDEQIEAEVIRLQAAAESEQEAAAASKASALAKLTKLGLTADEITALTGN